MYSDIMLEVAVELPQLLLGFRDEKISKSVSFLLETFGFSLNVVAPRACSDTSNWKEHDLGLIWDAHCAPEKALRCIGSRMEECHRHHGSFTGNWFAQLTLMQAHTPSISCDGRPQLL